MGCYNMDNTTLKACITRTLKNEFENCKIYKEKQEKPAKKSSLILKGDAE